MKHIIKSNGEEYWLNEKRYLHRVNGGPARINENGDESWYMNSYRNRINNPAMIQINGVEKWYE